MKTISLYNIKLSELKNIPQKTENLILYKLNIDTDLYNLNLPFSLKNFIIYGFKNGFTYNKYNFQKLIYCLKLPFGCKLYIKATMDNNFSIWGKNKVLYMDNIIYFIHKMNVESKILNLKFKNNILKLNNLFNINKNF